MDTKTHPGFSVPVFETVLPSGLTVLTADTGSAFAWVELAFDTGHLDNDVPGTAHFLEHLIMGDGRGRLHPDFRALRRGGHECNATTGNESVRFYLDGLVKDWETCVHILFRRCFKPIVTSASVEQEKPIIEAERAEVAERERIFRRFFQILCPDAPALHVSGVGTQASIADMTTKTLLEYHTRWFHPGNAVLIVVGGVDHASVCRLAARLRLPSAHPRRVARPLIPLFPNQGMVEDAHTSNVSVVFPHGCVSGSEQVHLAIGTDLIQRLAHVLLRDKKRLVYAVRVFGHGSPTWHSGFRVDVTPSYHAKVQDELIKIVREVSIGRVPVRIWQEIARSCWVDQLGAEENMLWNRDIKSLARAMRSHWINRDFHELSSSRVDLYKNATLEDVARAVATYFTDFGVIRSLPRDAASTAS